MRALDGIRQTAVRQVYAARYIGLAYRTFHRGIDREQPREPVAARFEHRIGKGGLDFPVELEIERALSIERRGSGERELRVATRIEPYIELRAFFRETGSGVHIDRLHLLCGARPWAQCVQRHEPRRRGRAAGKLRICIEGPGSQDARRERIDECGI